MKWFLNIVFIFLTGLLLFNIFQLDFNNSIFSEENSMNIYCAMFAIIGLLLALILYVSKRISSKNKTTA